MVCSGVIAKSIYVAIVGGLASIYLAVESAFLCLNEFVSLNSYRPEERSAHKYGIENKERKNHIIFQHERA